MKNIAIILSGCGVLDGSEIHESVLSMLAIEQYGAEWTCFAPNISQSIVVNHLDKSTKKESRNVLEESARIARGNIKDIKELNIEEFDGLIIPGGCGVIYNLSNYATQTKEFKIDPQVLNVCLEFAKHNKPAGYICIAPMLIPLIYQKQAKATLGNDKDAIADFCSNGGEHISCPVDDYVLDQDLKILSTPAYMLANNVQQANLGINRMIHRLLELA